MLSLASPSPLGIQAKDLVPCLPTAGMARRALSWLLWPGMHYFFLFFLILPAVRSSQATITHCSSPVPYRIYIDCKDNKGGLSELFTGTIVTIFLISLTMVSGASPVAAPVYKPARAVCAYSHLRLWPYLEPLPYLPYNL